MSKRKLTKSNMSDFYEILPDFRARCKGCQTEYCYTENHNFRKHLNKTHKTELEERINNFLHSTTESPEIYFDESLQICIICKRSIERQNFKNHLSNLHSVENLINHEINQNTDNYYEFTSQEDRFAVKCTLCGKPESLALQKGIRQHTKTCEASTNTQDISSIITNEDILWKHYTKLPAIDFRAKCKQCNNFQHNYINIDIIKDFNKHLRDNHDEIVSFEEEGERKPPWIFFMLYNYAELTFQCLVCDNTMSLTTLTDLPNCENIMNNHLDNECFSDFRNPDDYNCAWEWKYLKKTGKKIIKIKCQALKNNVKCEFEMPVELQLSLFDNHFRNEHYESADEVELSGSPPKKRKEGNSSKDKD